MKKITVIIFTIAMVFCTSLSANSFIKYPNIDQKNITQGIECEFLDVIDSSSVIVRVKDSITMNSYEFDEGEVLLLRFAFIKYVIDPDAKMCIREAAKTFLGLALKEIKNIYFYPLGILSEEEIQTVYSIVWIDRGNKKDFLNSLLVFNSYATVTEDIYDSYEFLFDFENEESDQGFLKGKVNF